MNFKQPGFIQGFEQTRFSKEFCSVSFRTRFISFKWFDVAKYVQGVPRNMTVGK